MPVARPRTPEQARADLRRMQDWDNGNYNVWQTPLAPLLAKYAPMGTAYARLKKLPAPVIFEPGVISGPANDGAPTFSPDGRTLLFERSNANSAVIMESHLENGRWSTRKSPRSPARRRTNSPASRPMAAISFTPPRAHGPSTRRKAHALELITHLWRVEKTPSGWSEPVRLPDTVNISKRVFKPSIAANGDLYFMSDEEPGDPVPKWRLYRAAFANGEYTPAQPLSFSDGTFPDVDPGVAPDQSYLIFSSKGRRAPDDQEHLFITFRQGSSWGPVEPLRYDGDNWGSDDGEAQIGPTARRCTSPAAAPNRSTGPEAGPRCWKTPRAWRPGTTATTTSGPCRWSRISAQSHEITHEHPSSFAVRFGICFLPAVSADRVRGRHRPRSHRSRRSSPRRRNISARKSATRTGGSRTTKARRSSPGSRGRRSTRNTPWRKFPAATPCAEGCRN